MDLTGEPLLRHCDYVDFEGEQRPSVGPVTLLSKLGQGGMGVVYHGMHQRLGNEVAIKLLPLSFEARDEGLVDRFKREAQLAARLHSEHLVRVFDIDRDEASHCHFIVMEFVRGLSAGAWRRMVAEETGRGVPEGPALDVCIAATEGLVAAHLQGIVHRDIKPDNILVPVDREGAVRCERSKLADLGLARAEAAGPGLTGTQLSMGTPGYMAPEQVESARDAKKPADVFSMGATLYALMAQQSPFGDSSVGAAIANTMLGKYAPIQSVRPDVSPATRALIDTCLAGSPAGRYPDAPALLEALKIARKSMARSDPAHDAVTTVLGFAQRDELGKRVRSDLASPSPTPTADDGLSAQPTQLLPGGDPEAETRGPTPMPTEFVARQVAEEVLGLESRIGPSGSAADGRRKGSGAVIGVVLGLVALLVALFVWEPWSGGTQPEKPTPPVVTPTPPVLPTTGDLRLASEPPGATVHVDGVEKGKTPVTVPGLGLGPHRVGFTKKYYEPIERPAVEVVADRHDPVSVTLPRARGRLTLTGGAPLAVVELRREGEPAKRYSFPLDSRGALLDQELEAGRYALSASAKGYAPPTASTVEIQRDGTASRAILMARLDGLLSIDSTPRGATVLVDGKPIGQTPIRNYELVPGVHPVELTLAEHECPDAQPVTIEGGSPIDLGTLTLLEWPQIDLSALESDVRVVVDERPLEHGRRLEPGTYKGRLERPGFAQQPLDLVATAGGKLRIEARPWSGFQARLDLRGLREGERASIDGREVTGEVPFETERDVEVVLSRPGSQDQPVTVRLVLGKSTPVPVGPWRPLAGSLDLSGLDSELEVTVEKDGRAFIDVSSLEPGVYRVTLSKRGHRDQPVDVTVEAGQPTRVRLPGPWVRTELTVEDIRAVLADIERWNATDSAGREKAARHVAKSESAFTFMTLERFSCGDAEHEMALFSHGRTGLEFVLIPGGTFQMGSPEDETGHDRGEVLHQVTLTRPFLIARTECTRAAWLSLGGRRRDPSRLRGGDRHPVDSVAWTDAAAWCEEAGLRLPTEAEWEYACRAGTSTAYSFGDQASDLPEYAWCNGNSGKSSHPVGEKLPNAFGLFDMHGNVQEWCLEPYVAAYPAEPVTDPSATGDADARAPHPARGGTYGYDDGSARSAARRKGGRARPDLGFRPVKPLNP